MRLAARALVIGLALLVPRASLRAQDGGEPEDAATPIDAAATDAAAASDAGATGCGALTYLGECDGDVVRYCLAGQPRSIDCANPAEFARGGPLVTCGLLDCTQAGCQGYWCVAKAGSACANLGCDVAAGLGCLDGVCSPSEPCDPQVFAPSCQGPVLTYCTYTVGNLDCSQGGTQPRSCNLDDPDRDPCVGEAGATCNLTLGRACAPELECIAGTCTSTLDAGEVPADAAVVEPDAGPPPDAASGRGDESVPADCACTGGRPGPAVPGLLVLLALARRRRDGRGQRPRA